MARMLVYDATALKRKTVIPPSSAGVYAFFHKLDADPHDSGLFRNGVERLVNEANQRPAFSTTPTGRGVGVVIRPANRDLKAREKVLDALKDNEDLRFQFRPLLHAISVWQQPVYVGKANNLQRRLAEHARGSRVVEDLQESNIDFRDLVVAAVEIDEDLADEDAHYLLELVAGTVSCPSELKRL